MQLSFSKISFYPLFRWKSNMAEKGNWSSVRPFIFVLLKKRNANVAERLLGDTDMGTFSGFIYVRTQITMNKKIYNILYTPSRPKNQKWTNIAAYRVASSRLKSETQPQWIGKTVRGPVMVNDTFSPTKHTLGIWNVYSSPKGSVEHYWPHWPHWPLFFYT